MITDAGAVSYLHIDFKLLYQKKIISLAAILKGTHLFLPQTFIASNPEKAFQK